MHTDRLLSIEIIAVICRSGSLRLSSFQEGTVVLFDTAEDESQGPEFRFFANETRQSMLLLNGFATTNKS
jgi:hypothetical protein